ncbi:hypothetical protein ACM26V_20100 [Salipaludibacillus sp. HK11]|uniref:hypothetical protein n=1 Tax=Salipaludibacillus sp. HK11 TaxID=3394320 RepID=UPI0039FC2BA9
MSDQKWNDKEIEKTLTKLPPIKDQQSKDELFRLIESRSKEETPARFTPKRKRTWLVPALASAAAIFLIILVIPSFFNGDTQLSSDNDSADQSEMNIAMFDSENNQESTTEANNDNNEIIENDSFNEAEDNENAAVEEAQEDGEVDESRTTTTRQLNNVMYTAEIHTVEHDEDSTDYTIIETKEISEDVSKEEALLTSLQESDPTSGQYLSDLEQVTIAGEVVVLHFASKNSLQSLTGAEHDALRSVFEELLSLYGFTELGFEGEGEGEAGIAYGQMGDNVESLPLDSFNRGYYLVNEEGAPYLISARMTGEEMANSDSGEPLNFAETVDKMTSPNDNVEWYESAIPRSISISEVRIPGNAAEIYYTMSNGELVDEERMQVFFHALKLTANAFTLDSLHIINEENGDVVEVDLAK